MTKYYRVDEDDFEALPFILRWTKAGKDTR